MILMITIIMITRQLLLLITIIQMIGNVNNNKDSVNGRKNTSNNIDDKDGNIMTRMITIRLSNKTTKR